VLANTILASSITINACLGLDVESVQGWISQSHNSACRYRRSACLRRHYQARAGIAEIHETAIQLFARLWMRDVPWSRLYRRSAHFWISTWRGHRYRLLTGRNFS